MRGRPPGIYGGEFGEDHCAQCGLPVERCDCDAFGREPWTWRGLTLAVLLVFAVSGLVAAGFIRFFFPGDNPWPISGAVAIVCAFVLASVGNRQ